MDPITIEEDSKHVNTRKVILQTIALLAAMGIVLWLFKGNGFTRITSFLAPPRSSTPSEAAPSPFPEPACLASQLEVTGAFYGCADPVTENPLPCRSDPADSLFSGLAHVQDKHHRYVLLMAVDAGYHGAGTYPLVPWLNSLVDARDGLAKILVQETRTGNQWRSIAGSLTINTTGQTGSVLADLTPASGSITVPARRLRIDGPWKCSAGTG